MADKPYDMFLPEVLPFVENCPEMAALHAIRNAVIDFCRQSLYLNQDLDPFGVTRGANTYELDVPTGYKLSHVIALYYNGARIDPKTQFELMNMYTRDWQSIPGKPRYFTQFGEDAVTFCLNPDATEALCITGRVAYEPLRASNKVDEVIYERYAELIGWGAIARLCNNAEQPYTDQNRALQMARLFKAECAAIRKKVLDGYNMAPQRVRFNRIM